MSYNMEITMDKEFSERQTYISQIVLKCLKELATSDIRIQFSSFS